MEPEDRQHIEQVAAGIAEEATGNTPDWHRHAGRWEGEGVRVVWLTHWYWSSYFPDNI